MTAPELTLSKIRKSPKLTQGKSFRASDLRTKEEQEAHIKKRAARKPKRKKFNVVDAYIAEMTARFGYDFYKAWLHGEIDDDKVNRMLAAERAREKAYIIPLESIVAQLVKDCIRRNKKEKKPTGPKEAAKILKAEIKIAMGEA